MKMGNAYVPDCRMYSGSGGRSWYGIFRKYETFGADPHTGKTASDGDLPERRDPLRECITAGCFLWSSRKNERKIQRVSHQCRGQDESGDRRKTFTDMQGMCGKRPGKKSCLTHGEKDAFFSFGEYLGYMDLEMQMRQLSLYENNLEAEVLKRKAEVSGKKKLYQGIGILGGLLHCGPSGIALFIRQ